MLAPLMLVFVKLTLAILAPVISTLFNFALAKDAPEASTPDRLAHERSEPVKTVLVSMAPDKSALFMDAAVNVAPVMVAPESVAPDRLALVKFALVMTAFVKLAFDNFASLNVVFVILTPESDAPSKLTDSKLDVFVMVAPCSASPALVTVIVAVILVGAK